MPILDLTAPTTKQLNQATEFIQQHQQAGVLVHCKTGYSRSAAIVAAPLLRTNRAASAEQAFQMLRSARPTIVIRPEIRAPKALAPKAPTEV